MPTTSPDVSAPVVADGDAPLGANAGRTGSRTIAVRHGLLLVLLYSLAAVVSLQPVIDADIWWHLRTGQWIVQHGTVPRVDSFSWSEAGQPWIAYSWLFDVVVYGLHSAAGISGLLAYEFGFILATLVALFHLVTLGERRPAWAAALTAVAFLAMKGIDFTTHGVIGLLGPRSLLVSVVFLLVVLRSVLAAYRSSRAQGLFLLVPLFTVWANLHVQFIYGLTILALVTVDVAITRWWQSRPSPLAPTTLLAVDAACVAATLVTPYHVDLYRVLFELGRQTGVYSLILELRAPQFVGLHDWAGLGLTLAAAFALGRGPRPRFLVMLFAVAVFVSFRSNRDVWFLVACATAVLVTAGPLDPAMGTPPPYSRRAHVGAVLTVMALFVTLIFTRSPTMLEAKTRENFPDAAAAAIQRGGYTGPLYNHFNWGGYLIWRLPELPVSMDGRSNLHGDERIQRSFRTWIGLRGWQNDPELSAAGVVIASTEMALASLLQRDARFEEVYSDAIARVFVARRHAATVARP